MYHLLSTCGLRKNPQSPVWPFSTKCLEEHVQTLHDRNTEARCYVVFIPSTIYLKEIYSIQARNHRYLTYSCLVEASAMNSLLTARQKARLYSAAFIYQTSTPIILYCGTLRIMILYCWKRTECLIVCCFTGSVQFPNW